MKVGLFMFAVGMGIFLLGAKMIAILMLSITLAILGEWIFLGIRKTYKYRSLTTISMNGIFLTYFILGWDAIPRRLGIWNGFFYHKYLGVMFSKGIDLWNGFFSGGLLEKALSISKNSPQGLGAVFVSAILGAIVLTIVSDLIRALSKTGQSPLANVLANRGFWERPKMKLEHLFSFPVHLLLKRFCYARASDGHSFALSARDGNFWFIGKMVVLLITWSFLAFVPIFILRNQIDFVFQGFLLLPPLSLMAGFLLGLVPVVGDFINVFLFHSEHGNLLVSIRKDRPEGFELGSDNNGEKYVLTEKNLNHHVQIVAPSGGGKTNIIKNFIHDRIQKGHGVIFLDYKADFEVAEFLFNTAKEFNRKEDLRIFSLSNRGISVPYNPLSHGSAAELQSRLINAFDWSEVYYKSRSESVLLKIFRGLTELRDLGKINITLKTVYEVFIKKGYARELSIMLRDAGGSQWDALEQVAAVLDRPSDAKELAGLVTNIEKVIYSGAGELLSDDAEMGAFTFQEAIDQGLITYFLMNSMSSKETATAVGKLLLQDLMGYVGRVYDSGGVRRRPITLVIDEFAEFAIPEFPSFLNRVRGAGIGVMIAHQTRGDLKAVGEDYQNKIEANTNTKIVAGVIDPEDAQFYSELIGTRTVHKETMKGKETRFLLRQDYLTGEKSVREVEEFIIHPNRVKRIEQGEVLVISRTVDTGYGMLSVPRARKFDGSGVTKTDFMSYLKGIREFYLDQAKIDQKSKVEINEDSKSDPFVLPVEPRVMSSVINSTLDNKSAASPWD